MLLPFRLINEIYHLGTMKPVNLGMNGRSHEGNCLSASLCPETWTAIVSLGGNPLYVLEKAQGVFVDQFALLKDPEFLAAKNEIIADLLRTGMLEQKVTFRVWSTDEEGQDQYRDYMTRDEAERESECDEGSTIEESNRLICTQLLTDQMGISRHQVMDGEHYGVMSWFKTQAAAGAAIDGMYQDFPLDELAMSAPLFAVYPEKLSGWAVAPAAFDERGLVEDDLLSTLPEILIINYAPM